jgi:hypothetical protein
MVSRHGDRTRRHGAPLRVVRLRRLVGCCSLGLVLRYAVWSPQSAALVGWYGPPSVQAQDRPAVSDVRLRHVAFLHRLRQADPRYQTIEKAVLNEQNELGAIVNRPVEMEAVRPLMKTLLTQIAKAFPGQNRTAIVYAPSEPPMKIGTARLQAQTRRITSIPAVPQSSQ